MAGATRSFNRQTRYDGLLLNMSLKLILARCEPTTIMASGLVTAPIELTGPLMIGGKVKLHR